jgi:hypothetical protein
VKRTLDQTWEKTTDRIFPTHSLLKASCEPYHLRITTTVLLGGK